MAGNNKELSDHFLDNNQLATNNNPPDKDNFQLEQNNNLNNDLSNKKHKIKFKKLSQNVLIAFLQVFINQASISIWSMTVLTNQIFRLTNNSNTQVGYVEAAKGVALLVGTPIGGILSDKIKRHYILKVAGVIDIIISVVFICLILYGNTLINVIVILCIWRFFGGVTSGAFEAILADSIHENERVYIYWLRSIILYTSMIIGPIINIIIFKQYDNNWSLEMMNYLMTIGLLINCISGFIVLFMNDKQSLKLESDSIFEKSKQDDDIIINKSVKWVPFITLLGGFITMISSGMTVKFFPLFLIEVHNIKPQIMMLTDAFQPIGTILIILTVKKVTGLIGRPQILILQQFIAGFFLILVCVINNVYVILPCYVLRSAFIRAPAPVINAIVAEQVPKKHRGKYSSIETLFSSFWTGSAVIGGQLIDHYNFIDLFYITVGVLSISCLAYSTLIFIIKK